MFSPRACRLGTDIESSKLFCGSSLRVFLVLDVNTQHGVNLAQKFFDFFYFTFHD